MSNAQKTHRIATNFNGKLATGCFIHVALAPADPLPESVLDGTTIRVETLDNSHPGVVVQLKDLARVKFKDLHRMASWITWCSHGMQTWDFIQWFISNHPSVELHPDTEFAVYFYQKQQP